MNGKLLALTCCLPFCLYGHAFPDHSEPKVGSTVSAPNLVKIWFDSELENRCKIEVKDSSDKRVDKDDAKLIDPSCLQISVEELKPGDYHVYWHVLARDGHPTDGDYTFTVQ